MSNTERPGRLEVLLLQLATGKVTRVRLRYACGAIKEHSIEDYAALPMACVLGAQFLGFVEEA